MKVAFVSQPWEPMKLPVERSIPIWIDQVSQRCKPYWDIVSYAPNAGDQQDAEQINGIDYRRIRVASAAQRIKGLQMIERALGFPNPNLPLYASRFYFSGYIRQIAQDIRREQCAIVHIANFSQFVPVVRAQNPDAKIVLHMHCEWLTQLDRAAIEKRLRQTDLVIGVSDHITDQVRARFPWFADRCRTVYNAVDFARFAAAADEGETHRADQKRLLYVGRVSPEKGVHVLLDAFRRVASVEPDVCLDIVGHVASAAYEYMVLVSDDPHVAGLKEFYDGSLRRSDYGAHLRQRIPDELADRVNFVDQVPHSATVDYYRNADLLVNPSLTEAFGMTLVEAMAVGTPVAATRVGGMTEIVEQTGGGRLVPPNDAEALAQAILDLLADREAYAALRCAGQASIPERFTWERTVVSLVEAYRRLYAEEAAPAALADPLLQAGRFTEA